MSQALFQTQGNINNNIKKADKSLCMHGAYILLGKTYTKQDK